MKSYRNIMHIGNMSGIEQISAIAIQDGTEQPVILSKSEYNLWLLLRAYQEKYNILERDIEKMAISFSDEVITKYNIVDSDIAVLVVAYQENLACLAEIEY